MSGAEFSGALDQRLTLLARAATRDDLGGASGAWVAGAKVWAALRPDGAGTEGEGDAPGANPRWQATVRAPSPVASQDRVAWRGLTLRVRRVAADPATPDRIIWYLEEER
ncbi:MAG TPA: head-tail adaptor protein [Sphingomonas sp.]